MTEALHLLDSDDVEAVGRDVTAFGPGDAVYGEAPHGAFAEYVLVPGRICHRLPENLSFEEAAFAVAEIQRALRSAGYNPGRIDGVYGRQTKDAVARYQRAKGLPTGGLTMDTLRRLGVRHSAIRGA